MKKFTIFLLIAACTIVFSCASKKNIEVEKSVSKPLINMIRVEGCIENINSFFLGIYPVKQSEYIEIMETNPSFFKGDDLPVESVTWKNAVEFCNRLSLREGLTPAYIIEGDDVFWNRDANGYRLPTDAEWEYACRAGTTTPFNTGNSISTSQANYDGRFPFNSNVRGEHRAKTTPVGYFAANTWGLFDMHGNVWEWCWDDPNSQEPDSSVLSVDTLRLIRGGAWSSSGRSLHSSFRSGFQPLWKNNYIGFRVARNE